MEPLHIFTDDYEFVIAADKADAVAVLIDTHGPYQIGPDDMRQLSDGRPFTLHDDERHKMTKLPAEWAAERGRGWLASSEG